MPTLVWAGPLSDAIDDPPQIGGSALVPFPSMNRAERGCIPRASGTERAVAALPGLRDAAGGRQLVHEGASGPWAASWTRTSGRDAKTE